MTEAAPPRSESFSPSLKDLLACPRDGLPLAAGEPNELACASGHRYPVIRGIPVLLLEEGTATIEAGAASRRKARGPVAAGGGDDLFLETIGVSDGERAAISALARAGGSGVDPVVQYLVAATGGLAYYGSRGRLSAYPIPELPLPSSQGAWLIDVGCNWGRWTIAAARKGYRAIGIDPQLGAVLAARRVADQLGISAAFVCGDARHLPLRPDCMDVAFSYSVLQHFSEADCRAALSEIARVLRSGAISVVQMANAFGLRSGYHLLRRGGRPPRQFEVRYYSPSRLLAICNELIGPSRLAADCYFGLGLQASDRRLYPLAARVATGLSEALKSMATVIPPLTRLADSLLIRSVRP
ncbi:MAG: methyltransferase domain-containing protein [Burkholderiales bacterium]|nr:methyltransferase domain-containing protein [Burkholderiales bacterium]